MVRNNEKIFLNLTINCIVILAKIINFNQLLWTFILDTVKNSGKALHDGVKLVKMVNNWTREICKGELSWTGTANQNDENKSNPADIIDYWKLFEERCKAESLIIQNKKWISPDDVLSVSSTATIAVPGVTIGNSKLILQNLSIFLM